MQVRRHLARWTAWFVLLNIAVGFCDCLRDPVSLPIHSNSSAALTTTSHQQERPIPIAVTIANPVSVMRPLSLLNLSALPSILPSHACRLLLSSPLQTRTTSE
jgi:hypothetical protein